MWIKNECFQRSPPRCVSCSNDLSREEADDSECCYVCRIEQIEIDLAYLANITETL